MVGMGIPRGHAHHVARLPPRRAAGRALSVKQEERDTEAPGGCRREILNRDMAVSRLRQPCSIHHERTRTTTLTD